MTKRKTISAAKVSGIEQVTEGARFVIRVLTQFGATRETAKNHYPTSYTVTLPVAISKKNHPIIKHNNGILITRSKFCCAVLRNGAVTIEM
jgi:hypothetical protein